ncbi:hypothetical protein K9M47_00745 [Candidatus Gracilibacteria bacterium]|nr:hypothetical protein [Candidatus Gracilibacteria bacterium]MCF7898342.1 hypothetical protein [Candidatus Paceibacterota bacterium]
MIKEIIKWEAFPKKLPKNMLGTITKVMIDRGNGVELATLDSTVPDRFKFFLECKGILGGTIIEDINEILYIAHNPIGPIELIKKEEKKKKEQKTP